MYGYLVLSHGYVLREPELYIYIYIILSHVLYIYIYIILSHVLLDIICWSCYWAL